MTEAGAVLHLAAPVPKRDLAASVPNLYLADVEAECGQQKDEIAEKYDQLLGSSRNVNSPLDINSDELYLEVLDFVLDSVKIGEVLKEISPDVILSKDLAQMTEDACIGHFNTIAQSTNTPVCLVSSQILAQHLVDVVKLEHDKSTSQTCCHLLPEEVKQQVNVLLNIINKIEESGTDSFDKLAFIKNLSNKDIPMELVWMLNENSVVSFRVCFLSWYDDEEWLEKFRASLASLCCDGNQDNIDLREQILQVFLGDLLLLSYGGLSESQEITQKSRQILFEILKHTVEKTEGLAPCSRLCLYRIIRELKDVPSDMIRKFFQESLNDVLTKPCSVTIQNAFASQDKWTFEFLSEATKEKYLQFVLVFHSNEIIQAIQHAVECIKSEPVNIQVLCHLLTVFLVQNEEAYKLFDDFLAQCLPECLENCDTVQFYVVLLLRRQATLEGAHISPSYSTWFEQTFVAKGASFDLNSKKTIHFIFKSLTELVPYDQPEFLKVHIFKCPQVPSKFKYYVDDYISLTKTRLQDLNIPLEDTSGIFAQSSSSEEHVKVMEQARSDVERCLLLYEQSGKIPTTIMEASIFRKPYFIGRFLPALLIPRNLSQEPDVRARLVDELNRAGKIPAAIFRSYEKKCERFEDYSNDDKPRDHIQQLTHCLEKLPNLLVDMATETDATKDLQSWLSSVSRKLKLIFDSNHQDTTAGTIDLDVVAVNTDKDYMQASYVIINVFCRACVAVQNIGRPRNGESTRAISKFHWASKFVSIVVSFPRLIQCLYVQLWSAICHEPQALSEEHIHGLAIFSCHLSCFKTSYHIRVQTTTKAKDECHQTFVDFISSQILLSSRSSAQFFLRWCCHYLQYALVVFEKLTTDLSQLSNEVQSGFAYVPKTMLVKMEYLYNKSKFARGQPNGAMFLEKKEMEILSLLIKSVNDAESLESCLSFKQWLLWELNTQEDILMENERSEYYNWIIYEHFMSLCKHGKDEFLEYEKMATEILSSILDHWTSVETDKVRSTITETNLIKILQDILGLMSSTLSSEQTSHNVWFLDCFVSRLNKIELDENPSNKIRLRCEVMAFIRLATHLPSWSLISSCECETLSDESTKKLSHFLNEYLRPWLFPGSLVLPFDITAHILKVFLKNLKSENENCRKREEIFQHFIENVPLMFSSTVYYFLQLKPLYHRHLPSSKTLQQLQSYHAYLDTVFTTEQPSERLSFSHQLVGHEMGQSYAIFLHLFKRMQSTISDIKDFVRRLNGFLDSLSISPSGSKIIVYLFDTIMARLSAMAFHKNEVKRHDELWYEISKAILFRCPHVLCIFAREVNEEELVSTRSILFEKETRRLLPVVFFRIVTSQERNASLLELPAESFTQAVLLMYIECAELYQSCCDSTIPSQPLGLETFVKITVFVKDFLSQVQSSVLQKIPQFVIKKLPKEVQRYFSR